MAIRKKQEPDEYQKALRKFHKKSNRHVVVFEADISEDEKRRIFSDADHLRQCRLVREFCCSGSDVSAKVLAMYAGNRTPPIEPQWLAAGLSQDEATGKKGIIRKKEGKDII